MNGVFMRPWNWISSGGGGAGPGSPPSLLSNALSAVMKRSYFLDSTIQAGRKVDQAARHVDALRLGDSPDHGVQS